MAIKYLSIEYFRGFYTPQKVNFAIPNGTLGSGLTVIVGQNNSGKTSLLDAFWHNSTVLAVPENERYLRKDCVLELVFDNGNKKKTISNGLTTRQENPNGMNPTVEYLYTRADWQIGSQQAATNYPAYLAFLQSNFLAKNFTDVELPRLLQFISQNDGLKAKVNATLKKFIPDFNDWYVEGQRVEYQINDDRHHLLDRFGNGFKSIFRIAACLASTNDNFIMVIDEPEFSLHPQAVRTLAEILFEESRRKQIVITTHSPSFVSWETIKNGSRIARVSKEKNFCKIYCLNQDIDNYEKIIKLERDFEKPQLMDTVAKELFFSNGVVFLEGQEDVGLIKKFIKENGIKINFDLFGYGSGGAGNIKALLQLANEIGIKCAAVFDGNKQDLAKENRDLFQKSLILTLTTPDIRDKYKRDEHCRETGPIETEGIFLRDGRIKEKYLSEFKKTIEQLVSFFNN